MFPRDKAGIYCKCHFPTNKVKSSQRKRRKAFASRDSLEKTSRAASSSRTLPSPGPPGASRRVKDQKTTSRAQKKSTDSKDSHPRTKEVKKFTYNNFGRSSDVMFGSDQSIVKPNPDTIHQSPDTDAQLSADNVSAPSKKPNAQTSRATANRHPSDTRTRSRAPHPPPQDENMSHCVVYDETDENPEDEEEAEYDEEDDEESAGVPQAVQAMRQTKVGLTTNSTKNTTDLHKRQMEDLARSVSSAHLIKRLSEEGYFNYNYSRHERVSYPSTVTKVVHNVSASKVGRKKKAEKSVRLVDWFN